MYNLGSNKTPSWSLWGKGLAAELPAPKALDLRFARLTLFQPALLRGFLGNGCFKQRKMVMETMDIHGLKKSPWNMVISPRKVEIDWTMENGDLAIINGGLSMKNGDKPTRMVIFHEIWSLRRHQTWLENSPYWRIRLQMCGFPASHVWGLNTGG